MHDANIMHRDLKPENVLIEENLHLKIVSLQINFTFIQIDFGDAKQFKPEDVYNFEITSRQSSRISETAATADNSFEPKHNSQKKDSFVGTPLYVSPEMLTDCRSLPASDLWALGVLIYRMHVG